MWHMCATTWCRPDPQELDKQSRFPQAALFLIVCRPHHPLPVPASDPAAATPDTERAGPSATSHKDTGEDNSTLLKAVRSVVQEELRTALAQAGASQGSPATTTGATQVVGSVANTSAAASSVAGQSGELTAVTSCVCIEPWWATVGQTGHPQRTGQYRAPAGRGSHRPIASLTATSPPHIVPCHCQVSY